MIVKSFGKKPKGDHLKKCSKSPHFKKGSFHNLSHTPEITEGYGYGELFYEFFFKRNKRRNPIKKLPSLKTDLHKLDPMQDVLVWFGHSSYFMQIAGKKILVDPVFSGNASPIAGTNKAFPGSDVYAVEDLPNIDYLIITHDHYDHLDNDTVLKLKSKTIKILCGLGVASHLEAWGFSNSQIQEFDWNDSQAFENGFTFHALPARHFSGRGLSRNKTLWLSFMLETTNLKLYIGGDSGYDTHFAEIGKRFGSIDLAILENGQYDIKWKYIHMHPEEVLKAAGDLNAKRFFPVHSSKFAMANHAWDEPLNKISELNQAKQLPMLTPMIGELVLLNDVSQDFGEWWRTIE